MASSHPQSSFLPSPRKTGGKGEPFHPVPFNLLHYHSISDFMTLSKDTFRILSTRSCTERSPAWVGGGGFGAMQMKASWPRSAKAKCGLGSAYRPGDAHFIPLASEFSSVNQRYNAHPAGSRNKIRELSIANVSEHRLLVKCEMFKVIFHL